MYCTVLTVRFHSQALFNLVLRITNIKIGNKTNTEPKLDVIRFVGVVHKDQE